MHVRHPYLILVICLSLPGTFSCRTAGGLVSTIGQNFVSPRPSPTRTAEPVSAEPRFSALWVGHSTVLLQMGDKVILTDPWFTNHVALLKMRLVEPGIALEQLHRLDLVTVSHSHADHCNLGTLGMIAQTFPGTPLVFPDGVEEFLPDLDLELIRLRRAPEEREEIAGETRTIDGIGITAVRARHWGGRYGLDGTVWGEKGYSGFIIQHAGRTVYFSGDTGYDPQLFVALGRTFRIDLAILPIGPTTHPDSTGGPIHMYARGALLAFQDLNAGMLLPVHYGTTHEPFDRLDPRAVLEDLLSASPEIASRVTILDIGQRVVLP
jgi:L-ascorbate metabolism protein UlaG (beta-lactamase superfamily)